MKYLPALTSTIVLATGSIIAEERPNIVWITSEDNSAHWIGCYGNKLAKTPNIDALASSGIRYKHAYSNAPVCAVARCTLLMGRYATSLGTQNMRSRYPIPGAMKSYAQLLNKAGYQTSNPGKTDYNILGKDKSHWNTQKSKKPWQNKDLKKPFFHVINFFTTHESCLFNGKNGNKPVVPKRVNPSEITLPPYLIDTPEARADWAAYYDKITSMDKQVGNIVDSIKKSPNADNTIIFYYSDHGGVHPRSKRFVFRTGTQVPFIVHLPKKWQHLSSHKPGSSVEDIVSFVDFGPTILDITGAGTQPDMQGTPFLGKNRKEKNYAFLYSQRFDEQVFKFARAVTDGKYRYVKNFYPHRNRGIPGGYPYGQQGWRSYKKALDAGKGNAAQNFIWNNVQPDEELYDITADPWEVNNIINDQSQKKRISAMREALRNKMLTTKDTGVLPEMFYNGISKTSTVYEFVNSEKFPYKRVLDTAWNRPKNTAELKALLSDKHPAIRFWAATHCSINKEIGKEVIADLKGTIDDKFSAVNFAAAEALHNLGQSKAASELIKKTLASSDDDVIIIRSLDLAKATGLDKEIDDQTWNQYCSKGKYGARLKR